MAIKTNPNQIESKAVSVVAGTTTALRRVVVGTTADNGAPTLASQFKNCSNFTELTFDFTCVGGTSATFQVYWYSEISGLIKADVQLGTSGVSTVNVNTVYSPSLPTGGCSGVYIRTQTFVGGGATASAWAYGNQ